MGKRFRKGLKYVFTSKKYKQDNCITHYSWHKRFNGTVITSFLNGSTDGYFMDKELGILKVDIAWCKCIGRVSE
ncbi:hypothetical protein KM792_13770 [Clostridium tyrobutyricum]|uniref:hypothetical protein n=1 Tax=Clostridium tyrobutyricum TaxID=1519 RepID=UPI0002D2F526|nr:hypothetical protein [Clostridium tyrobutyricum]MBV4450712.1 hypothetical protein [Clostridium tyrobutyricum]